MPTIHVANDDQARVAALLAEAGISFSFGNSDTTTPLNADVVEKLAQWVYRLEQVTGPLQQAVSEMGEATTSLNRLESYSFTDRLQNAAGRLEQMGNSFRY